MRADDRQPSAVATLDHIAHEPRDIDLSESRSSGVGSQCPDRVREAKVLTFRGSREPLSSWEKAIALATIELVAAYRHLQRVQPTALPPESTHPFQLVCSGMCASLHAIDLLGATVWDEVEAELSGTAEVGGEPSAKSKSLKEIDNE